MNVLSEKMTNRILDVTGKDTLTTSEISVLILLSKIQDNNGYCNGVYWQHLADYASMSKSGYYHTIKELEEKNIIKQEVSCNNLMNIRIKHDSNESTRPSFIDLDYFVFQDKEFYELKANAKRLLLHIILDYAGNITSSHNKNLKEFHKRYCNLMNIKDSSMRRYLRDIEKWVQVKGKKELNRVCSSVLIEKKENIELIIKRDNEVIYREKIKDDRLKQIIQSEVVETDNKKLEIII